MYCWFPANFLGRSAPHTFPARNSASWAPPIYPNNFLRHNIYIQSCIAREENTRWKSSPKGGLSLSCRVAKHKVSFKNLTKWQGFLKCFWPQTYFWNSLARPDPIPHRCGIARSGHARLLLEVGVACLTCTRSWQSSYILSAGSCR